MSVFVSSNSLDTFLRRVVAALTDPNDNLTGADTNLRHVVKPTRRTVLLNLLVNSILAGGFDQPLVHLLGLAGMEKSSGNSGILRLPLGSHSTVTDESYLSR